MKILKDPIFWVLLIVFFPAALIYAFVKREPKLSDGKSSNTFNFEKAKADTEAKLSDGKSSNTFNFEKAKADTEAKLNEGSEFSLTNEIKLGKDFIKLNKHGLVIRREGALNFLTHGIKGNKEIYYKNISSIQIKKAGVLTGFIQFEIPGSSTSVGGLMSAMSDENTVKLYTELHNEIAQKIKDFIEDYLFTNKQ